MAHNSILEVLNFYSTRSFLKVTMYIKLSNMYIGYRHQFQKTKVLYKMYRGLLTLLSSKVRVASDPQACLPPGAICMVDALFWSVFSDTSH